MRATSLVLIGVSQIHVVLNILINRNYSYCNTMYKWINKRFCLSVCLSVIVFEPSVYYVRYFCQSAQGTQRFPFVTFGLDETLPDCK